MLAQVTEFFLPTQQICKKLLDLAWSSHNHCGLMGNKATNRSVFLSPLKKTSFLKTMKGLYLLSKVKLVVGICRWGLCWLVGLLGQMTTIW